ncbi:MAG: HAMP domain-containing protein [Sneathiella sp.]|nr:HAMP domain-containing protein [Sneathiella sp.]
MSFGTLVSVAVLAVLGVSIMTGLTNTRDLLLDKATSEMETIRRNLTSLLDPAEDQVRYIANLIYENKIDIDDEDSLNNGLLAALAGSSRIKGLVFIYPDLRTKLADRRTGTIKNLDNSHSLVAMKNIMSLSETTAGSWSRLLYSPDANETVLSFRHPITRDGIFLGLIIAGIPISTVNEAVKTDGLSTDEGRFILYGKDHVLTQQGFHVNSKGLTHVGVVPTLAEISDPILSSIWTAPRSSIGLLRNKIDFEGHTTEVDGERYKFYYSSLDGYTDRPLIIGYRVRYEDATREVRRLGYAGVTGIVILLLSIITAFFIGRKISRPIVALSQASQKISKLDFNLAEELPTSRLKELSDASEAYNTMLRGLSWFENYVPKSLVRKLMETGTAHSETRSVTVMFTDIIGFTPMAESMASEDVAHLLNSHFELLTNCIEAEGGTVDKFIGDSVMAFWGAPEYQTDHAARACRAAAAIDRVISEDNKQRVKAGQKPVRIRVGIHTGRLVVGNIGSSGRINYTVVGDTVNVAQRIEQLGKKFDDEKLNETITLMSQATFDESKQSDEIEDVGEHLVKGKNNSLRIYKLR